MLIAPKHLKIRTSNWTHVSRIWSRKYFQKRWHGQGHMTPKFSNITWHSHKRFIVFHKMSCRKVGNKTSLQFKS